MPKKSAKDEAAPRRRGAKAADAKRKRDYIKSYLPHVSFGLADILKLKPKEEKKVLGLLTDILEKDDEKTFSKN